MRRRLRLAALRSLALPICAAALLIAVMCWLGASSGLAASPNALWRVVHDLCAPDMKLNGIPAPCSAVDLKRGFAVLKDMSGQTQMLVIPTRRILGIEDPRLLEPTSPNYWQAAWDARALFEKRAKRPVPRQDIGLAVNSVYGRSQNQLHIHIDCLRPDVAQALASNQARIEARWAPLGVDLVGRRYQAMRIDGEDLGPHDPFKLLAEGQPDARAAMGRQSLVLVGAAFADGHDGFILLSHPANMILFDNGHGEDLLDHRCGILEPHSK
jgi:CDP-diacylglycerol pyrophosphatase